MSITIIIAIIILLGGTISYALITRRLSNSDTLALELLQQTNLNTAKVIASDEKQYHIDRLQHEADMEKMKKVKALFQKFPASLMFADGKGLLLSANERALSYYHMTDDNDEILPYNIMFLESAFRSVVDPKTLHAPMHFCEISKDVLEGKTRYFEKSFIPIKDRNGNTQNVLSEVRDLSEERAAERLLAKEEKDMDETYNQLMAVGKEMEVLFKNHDIYLFTADWNTRMMKYYINPTEPVKEFSFDEFIAHMVGVDHKYLLEHQDEVFKKYMQNHATKVVFRNFLDENDTKLHVIQHKSSPMHDLEGNIIGTYGVHFDITKEEEKREKLVRERETADMSAKQKSVFLSSMSHEIRTPLNGIVGFSQLLPMMETKEERKEILDLIQSSCDSMKRLFDDIKDAGTLGKTISIEPREVDFSKEFGNVCTMLSLRVTEPNVQYIVENPLESLMLKLDMGRMQQVISNFLTNAVKYTHEGHIKLGYTYSEAEGLYVYCEDTGTGIPKEKQASAFEQFVKLNDNVQGTGLGLNICKQIVEKSGGEIGLDSEEGKGCNFWFRIPTSAIAV